MNVARSTQNTAWELWMKMAFGLTQDPVVLEELLDVSSRSISEFIDSNMRVITRIILEEKHAQAHDDHVDKRGLVSRLLDGRDVDAEQFARRLGYSLAQKHQAFLVWSETPEAHIRPLEDMARALASLTGAGRRWWCSPGLRPYGAGVLRQGLWTSMRCKTWFVSTQAFVRHWAPRRRGSTVSVAPTWKL